MKYLQRHLPVVKMPDAEGNTEDWKSWAVGQCFVCRTVARNSHSSQRKYDTRLDASLRPTLRIRGLPHFLHKPGAMVGTGASSQAWPHVSQRISVPGGVWQTPTTIVRPLPQRAQGAGVRAAVMMLARDASADGHDDISASFTRR